MVNNCEIEYDFVLIVGGIHELTDEIANTLFESGCSDATVSMNYGNLYIEFSRKSPSFIDAVLSAIGDVRKAGIAGAKVLMVDDCNLVTQAEIARRARKSRQCINQYISGERGPGGFPAPECCMTEGVPLWAWCAVSYWLWQHDFIKQDIFELADIRDAINTSLKVEQRRANNPDLSRKIEQYLSVT